MTFVASIHNQKRGSIKRYFLDLFVSLSRRLQTESRKKLNSRRALDNFTDKLKKPNYHSRTNLLILFIYILQLSRRDFRF
jgi:hypothetical protein